MRLTRAWHGWPACWTALLRKPADSSSNARPEHAIAGVGPKGRTPRAQPAPPPLATHGIALCMAAVAASSRTGPAVLAADRRLAAAASAALVVTRGLRPLDRASCSFPKCPRPQEQTSLLVCRHGAKASLALDQVEDEVCQQQDGEPPCYFFVFIFLCPFLAGPKRPLRAECRFAGLRPAQNASTSASKGLDEGHSSKSSIAWPTRPTRPHRAGVPCEAEQLLPVPRLVFHERW